MSELRVRLWLLKDDWLRLKPEKLLLWFVWKLPRRLIYWSVVRAAVKDQNEYPSEVTAIEMLKKFS